MAGGQGERTGMRDRETTEARIVAAVGQVLAKSGFSQCGVNTIAREAGVDKALIYRYFGGLPQLLEAYGRSQDFWPDAKELAGGDPARLAGLPPGEAMALVLGNLLGALRRRPATLEILAWETVDRNELTAILEAARQRTMADFAPLLAGVHGALDPADLANILTAAINYLLVRGRKIRLFGSLDIRSDEGFRHLEKMLGAICRACLDLGDDPPS